MATKAAKTAKKEASGSQGSKEGKIHKIQFYPLDLTYKIRDNKAYILLFGRTIDGKTICVVDDDFEPYFWAIPDKGVDMETFREALGRISEKEDGVVYKVVRTEIARKKYLYDDVEAVKVIVSQPPAVPKLREKVRDMRDARFVLESDILFVRRYLIDKKITPSILYEVEGEETKERVKTDYIIKAKSITQVSDDTIKPKILAFDIETYNPTGKNFLPEKYPILMLSFYGANFKKVITWKRFKTKHDYIEFVDGEADLIARFREIVEEYSPDILVGYYSDGFDLPYIKKRAEKYKINLDVGLDHSSLKESRGKTTSISITGISHIDIFRFIKFVMGGSLETDYFDLDSVSEEILGEKKKDVDIEMMSDVWDNEPEKLEPYCEYNLHDSLLAYKLAEQSFPNIVELVKIVSLPFFDATRMSFSQLVESYLLRQAPDYHVLAPNKAEHDEMRERIAKTFKGAFVFEPKPGLYKDIAVFDFRSLYPTIIASHNISPATLNAPCPEQEREYAPVEGKKVWFCKSSKEFLPRMIEELITRRLRIKEILKTKKDKHDKLLEARSYSLKILANAFYGYLGFYASRWYSIECADAVTAWGRHYITSVIKKAQDSGFTVLYSDTDSIFLSVEGKKKDDALKFVEKINMDLPELMELDFEGFYPRGIFVSARLTGYGAKKKYALLAEDGRIKIRGFELVRRNWSLIAKDTQEEVIKIILKENNIEKAAKYVQDVVDSLRKNKTPIEKVILHMQLQKEMAAYENEGPHVAVAKRMEKMGIPVGAGTMIEYVITAGKEKIRDRAKLPSEVTQKDYDSEYYINNQVIPAVEKLFDVLGRKIAEETKSKEQSKLQSFFGKKK